MVACGLYVVHYAVRLAIRTYTPAPCADCSDLHRLSKHDYVGDVGRGDMLYDGCGQVNSAGNLKPRCAICPMAILIPCEESVQISKPGIYSVGVEQSSV